MLVEVATSSTSIHTEVIHIGTGEAIRATEEEDRRSGWDVYLLEEMSSRWGLLEGSTDGVWFEIDRWTDTPLGRKA